MRSQGVGSDFKGEKRRFTGIMRHAQCGVVVFTDGCGVIRPDNGAHRQRSRCRDQRMSLWLSALVLSTCVTDFFVINPD